MIGLMILAFFIFVTLKNSNEQQTERNTNISAPSN